MYLSQEGLEIPCKLFSGDVLNYISLSIKVKMNMVLLPIVCMYLPTYVYSQKCFVDYNIPCFLTL